MIILKICAQILCFILVSASPVSNALAAWTAPKGIPEPKFGIDQSHEMYANVAGYRDAGNGPYTHYVDNSASCTDTGNDFGTPASPRCTVPAYLTAGSVVEVHGGPYTTRRDWIWQLDGTPDQPVFIRGVDLANNPEFFDGRMYFSGSYGIIESLDIRQTIVFFTAPADHLSLRNSHVHDHPGAGALVLNRGGNHIVIYNNEIDHNGEIPSKKDRHGIFTGSNSHHVWIVDNHIHHNSGDAIQFCHGCVGKGNGPAYVYIGRNHMHDDEENAIDVKEFIGPVIISENIIENYLPSIGSNGDAIRVNDEGAQGDIWIIFNRISNSALGIEPSKSAAQVFVISNVINNIERAAVGWDADFVLNNTIYDVGDGIRGRETQNNIVAGARHIAIADEAVNCANNLVFRGSVQSRCAATISRDPRFIFNNNGDLLGVASNSPAVGAGLAKHPVYAMFFEQFGISIESDENGIPRPDEGSWSIGAHEPVDSVAPSPGQISDNTR